MNRRMIFYILGQMLKTVAGLMALPMFVAFIYEESCIWAFLISITISLLLGTLLSAFCKTEDYVIYAKEGFVIVALGWLSISLVGALPYYISGAIPSYIDAFFEAVNGFTTTGASIISDIESMSNGIQFWHNFTQWIGGMGVLVFIMAILPKMSDRTIHILRAEMPGPIVGKLVPKARDTAKLLYLIYIIMTVTQAILLSFGGMTFFESLMHAFSTASTGGFSLKADSIASYNSYTQWVIAIFMMLFGVNFNLFYLMILKKPKSILKSEELWIYVGLIAVATVVITVNIYPLYESVGESIRAAFFQTTSIISTTAYTTADYTCWPQLAKGILFIFMLTGACAGSTAGGFKLSRVVLLIKMIRREIKKLIHPRAVTSVRFEGRKVEQSVLSGVAVYLALYVVCIVTVFLLLCLEPFDFETNLSAAVSCFNNIGPGFGSVGPTCNYADYSYFSKIILSVAMLFGRLEIYPLLFAFSPSIWSKKNI